MSRKQKWAFYIAVMASLAFIGSVTEKFAIAGFCSALVVSISLIIGLDL